MESFETFNHNKQMIPDPLMETHGAVDSLTIEKAAFLRRRFSWKEGPRSFIARYSWNGNGDLSSREGADQTRLYAYDENGRETACYLMDGTGTVTEREIREWDTSSRLIRRTVKTMNPASEEVFSYEHDDAGRMLAERRGNHVRVEKRDREGRLIQEYFYDGDRPDLVSDYVYDEEGRLTSVTVKDPDGRMHQETSHRYDGQGRLEALAIQDSEGRILRDETYAYGASLGERWLERVTWVPDGVKRGRRKPVEVIYRSFTLGEDQPRQAPEENRNRAFSNGVYSGPLSEGKPEGEGLFRYNDESIYQGEFHGGVMSGHGQLSWPDGRRMEGLFTGGLLEGRGSCTWSDGSRYDGEFRNGRMHGVGTFKWADGTRFEGLFEGGRRTDQGAWEKK